MSAGAVAIVEPLPTPTPADPIPRLPAWFQDMTRSVGRNFQPDDNGVWADRAVLMVMPSDHQRQELEVHKDHLKRALAQTPLNGVEFHKRSVALISKLLTVMPGKDSGLNAAHLRIETYEMALDDVPYWSVAKAIRGWYRGEVGYFRHGTWFEFDTKWAPSPAELRHIAMRTTDEMRERVALIDHVMACVPYVKATRPPLPGMKPLSELRK
jgi:hypothetical protein